MITFFLTLNYVLAGITASLFCSNFYNHEFLDYSSTSTGTTLLEDVLEKFYAELTTPNTVVVQRHSKDYADPRFQELGARTMHYLLNFDLNVTDETNFYNEHASTSNHNQIVFQSTQDGIFILIWDSDQKMRGFLKSQIPHPLHPYNHKYFGTFWNSSRVWLLPLGKGTEEKTVPDEAIFTGWKEVVGLCNPSTSLNMELGQVFISNLYGEGTLGKCLNPLYDGANYCWMGRRVIANLMVHFNFTPSYMGPNLTSHDSGRPIGNSNAIFQESGYSVLKSSNPSFKFYYLRAIQAKFISYCDPPKSEVIRKLDVSLRIWLAPFHSIVWVSLILALLLLKVFALQDVLEKCLQGSKNIGDLYVQLTQFLGLTFVLILAAYESYVTTSEIIPRERTVFSNVLELIGNNYKLYHFEGENNPMQEDLNDSYLYDLQHFLPPGVPLADWFHVVKGKRYEDAWPVFLNLTRTERIGNINWEMYKSWDVVNMGKASGADCHTIPTPFSHQKSYWLFQGGFRKQFAKSFSDLVTSGIVGWWDVNGLYWAGIHYQAQLIKDAEANRKKTQHVKSISLQHKLTSIFPITGYLFLLATLMLIIEFTYVKFENLH